MSKQYQDSISSPMHLKLRALGCRSLRDFYNGLSHKFKVQIKRARKEMKASGRLRPNGDG